MLRLFWCSLIFLSVHAAAQDGFQRYRFPGSVPASYVVNAKQEYDHIWKQPFPGHRKRDLKRFAEITSYGKKHLLASGNVYYDPPLAEAYLDDIAAQMVPPGVQVKVYLMREADYNAYAIHDGSLFMNVGTLAEMPNEAALAIILGHEIAHYVNDDNRVSFFNKLQIHTRRNRDSSLELRIDKAHEDRTMEHVADSMGYLLAHSAGFELRSGITNFLLMLEEEEMVKRSHGPGTTATPEGTTQEALLAEHPDTRDRIARLENWLSSDPSLTGGASFLVDSTTFMQVRDMARRETLQVLLDEHEYPECIRRAFRFHLMDPDNDAYLFYLAESLRRNQYIDPTQEDLPFLSKGSEQHLGEGESILCDLSLLIADSLVRSTIDASVFFQDDIPIFNSNAEALDHFLRLGEERDVVEMLLTKAIHHRNEQELREDALERYLARGGAASVFAKAFLEDKLEEDLMACKGELLLVDEMDFVEDRTYGYRVRHLLGEQRSERYLRYLGKLFRKRFGSRTVVIASQLKAQNLNDHLAFQQAASNMMVVQWMRLREERQFMVEDPLALEIHFPGRMGAERTAADSTRQERTRRARKDMRFYFIDPHYYEFLVSKGYRTVEHLKITSFDDKTRISGNLLGGLFFLYPGYWTQRAESGSNRFAFEVKHNKFNTISQEVYQNEVDVPHKMTKPNLASVIYESLFTIDQ